MTITQVYGSSFFEVFKNISKVFFDLCFLCDVKNVEKCISKQLFRDLLESRSHYVQFPQVSSLNGSSRQKRKALLQCANV